MQLENKVAVITGASRGLGRALALRFAAEGAKIVIVSRHQEFLEAVRREIVKQQGSVLALVGDVSYEADAQRIGRQTLSQFGRIDILVNNAGILGPSPRPNLLEYNTSDFNDVLRINTVGVFLMSKAVIPHMLNQGSGSVINLTSEAGKVGYAGWGAYGVSKFAVEGLSQTWAAELEETGVRVNYVDPGSLNTQMQAEANPDEDLSEMPKPEDVTEVFVYLASDAAAQVNGERFEAQEFAAQSSPDKA